MLNSMAEDFDSTSDDDLIHFQRESIAHVMHSRTKVPELYVSSFQ
jgi:hypothetical protein